MLPRKALSVIVILVLISTLACLFGGDRSSDAPVSEGEPQETTAVEVPATATVNLQATNDAQSTAEALSTANALATEDARAAAEAQATATAAAEATQVALDRHATATQAGALKQTATAEVVLQATAQAQTMADRIQILYDDGIVTNQDGAFARLEDFDQSWAQINWFKWWKTGYEPENFAVSADVAWSSASDKANWFNSGCGFVFGIVDGENFHVSHLTLDGFVTLQYWQKGKQNWIAKRPTKGITIPDGEAEVILVAYDKRVTVYVNETKVLSEYAGLLQPGSLALTLVSGNNIDYGTRCQMTDIDLWIFE